MRNFKVLAFADSPLIGHLSHLSHQCQVPLEVAEVDQRIGQFTPVAQWNFREVQRAHRGGILKVKFGQTEKK